MIHRSIPHGARRHDPATVLIRALLDLCEGRAELLEHRGKSWASATFAGMRHVLRLGFQGPGVATGEWLAGILPEHEFDLPGHIVADAAVIEQHRRTEGEPRLDLTIEVLTVEDV